MLASMLLISLLFTLPYVAYSSKRQRFIENEYMIPALQSEIRTKFNRWVYITLTASILQNVILLILSSECPLYPYEYQDGGARFKSWLAFLFIPLSQALIDYGYVFIASQVLRALLPYHTSNMTLGLVFILSFVATLIQLIFKLVDTKYDMLIALLFPLVKFFPFILSVRDSLNSAYEFRTHLVHDRVDQAQQGKLITLYRLNQTFL